MTRLLKILFFIFLIFWQSSFLQAFQKKPQAKQFTLTKDNLHEFLNEAATASQDEEEAIREAIHRAKNDSLVLTALIAEFNQYRTRDFSKSLVILSIIGEMAHPSAIAFFEGLLAEETEQPYGKRFEYLSKRDLLEMMQTLAIQSLAYMKTPQADSLVLAAIQQHPAIAVRTAGIDAYLFNRNDSKAAKQFLRSKLDEDQWIYLDRVRRKSMASSDAFNDGLRNFYERHPEEIAPLPERITPRNITNIGLIKPLLAMTILFILTFLIIRKFHTRRKSLIRNN